MVRTEQVDIAWRTLDAQYWGVPQRRKRIFLVADFTGQCAGEILFVEEGLRGHFAESRKTREEAAATVGDCVEEPNCLTPWDCQSKRIFKEDGKWPTLYSGEGGGAKNQAVLINNTGIIPFDTTGITSPTNGNNPTLRAAAGASKHETDWESLVIELRSQDGVCRIHENGIVPTLNTAQGGQRQPCIVAFGISSYESNFMKSSNPHSGIYKATTARTLDLNGGNPGCNQGGIAIVEPVASIDCRNLYENEELSGVLQAKENGGYSLNYINPIRQGYAVRRLTPLECELLQGLPSGWTDIPGASDTARYKAIGNGIAKPCSDFVLQGIARVLREVNL